jgi:hypothetical protein
MTLTLPPSAYESHFPGSGRGLHPVIDTDGECLILRRVKIGTEYYDIRIWRFDAKDALIRLSKDSSFLKEVMVDVQTLVMKLFEDNFEDITEKRVWYSDKDPRAPVCHVEQKSLPKSNPNKFQKLDAVDNPEVVQTMASIHSLFFNAVRTVVSADPNPQNLVLRPNVVSKEEEGAPASTSAIDPSIRISTGIPDHIKVNIPPALIDEETSTDATPPATGAPPVTGAPIPTAKEHVHTLQEALDAASEEYLGPDFLDNVTYQQLESFARNKTADPTLKKAYEAYKAVLKDPEATGADNDAMRRWLKHHYLAAHTRYQMLKSVWEKDKKPNDFDQWCQYYAAKAIAGFIYVESQSIDKLVDFLKGTTIPAATAAATAPVTVPTVKKGFRNLWGWWT